MKELFEIKRYEQQEIATPDDLEVAFASLKWIDDVIAETNNRINELKEIRESIESNIISYHEENNYKTYKGENGKISDTTSDSWDYVDEKSIVNQLKSVAPEFVKVTEKIDKKKFKKSATVNEFGEVYLEVDGQFILIDNVEVAKERKLSVKV